MEFNKPVSNPMMVGSIELLKAEDTPEHRQMFLEELQKAKFLAPVVIDSLHYLYRDAGRKFQLRGTTLFHTESVCSSSSCNGG